MSICSLSALLQNVKIVKIASSVQDRMGLYRGGGKHSADPPIRS